MKLLVDIGAQLWPAIAIARSFSASILRRQESSSKASGNMQSYTHGEYLANWVHVAILVIGAPVGYRETRELHQFVTSLEPISKM
jgi:hypothetical protein